MLLQHKFEGIFASFIECGIEWVVCGTHRADKSLFGGVVVFGCVHSGTITVHHAFLSVGAAST